ncbi:HAD-IIIC family phosphatase [Sphingomonas sp. BIUV-7]|uniref:HAD-IIIC family phosphatase n=1 Tax=Sphingomonas natans TaxID=3063330 RepID=A0ABT8Y5T4_9SPHN|nr:HAD-IIIC family phosphatase [Sphingomonas sp. BIUV-7]MDO6413679.1 HAD-IIIC family phosphatase [Sphingomonas sp. BIUV-7]
MLHEGRRKAAQAFEPIHPIIQGVFLTSPSGPSANLYWLPSIDDWSVRIAEIERSEVGEAAWNALVALAGVKLDFVRVGRLDKALMRLFGDGPPVNLATRPIRLAVLASSTTAQLASALRVAGLRRGLWITLYEPDYGQYRQELANPASGLYGFAPTAILFALDAGHLVGDVDPALNPESAEAVVHQRCDLLQSLWRSARAAFGAQIIQQTVLPVFPPLLGSNEQNLPGSRAAIAAEMNARLRAIVGAEGVGLLAIDAWATQLGLDAWHDPVLWHRAKQEITPRAAPLYGDLVARLLAAGQGRASKALVLDLDNTLWGGVIGDDGLQGIVVGQGDPLGEAFAAFQTYAAGLERRGILLAACSKNDESNALSPFEHHPDMVLRRSRFSAFVANWDDKASNLKEIARQLNIGLDSLVFVDDNPFERNLVRRELPMVSVPELPEDPALFARCLADAGYFEGLTITAEDRGRTALYETNREREASRTKATDLNGYLASLEMALSWRTFDRVGLARTVQLINKTNQFNLTTRRYTEDEVAAVMTDPSAFGLQFRLTDRFGDNGIIAVIIGRVDGAGLCFLDTWLMSCRVLGRRVEEATLAVVVEQAIAHGATELVGCFRRTAQNGMVADHYDRLGFTPLPGQPGDTERLYRRDVAETAHDFPITIRSE